MFTTFLLLSFTGWGLKYAYVEPSSAWISVWGGPKMAGIIHRVAGITMLLDFIYHQFYLLNLARKRDLRLTIIPMPKDVVDMVHNFMYYSASARSGLTSASSPIFRSSTTGPCTGACSSSGPRASSSPSGDRVRLFPTFTLGWVWDVLFTMHSDEALLAIVFILIIHFYMEHLRSDVFP